jgi:NADPH2:quinone reductase
VLVVYEGSGGNTFMTAVDWLARRGMMVNFGNASGPVEPFTNLHLAQKGSLLHTRPTLYDYTFGCADLEQSASALFDVVTSGKVKIEVGQRFRLSDAAEAHRALEARQTSGSTVLTI